METPASSVVAAVPAATERRRPRRLPLQKRKTHRAFTVIELVVVMTIILVLAGLILATSGYVQQKGARSRAQAEIAAMSAALENYRADNGIYPQTAATNSLDAKVAAVPKDYERACSDLYAGLVGDANYDDITDAGATSYMTFKPNMKSVLDTTKPPGSANRTFARDPFGNSYGYSTACQADSTKGYNPTFDLWSTANETDSTRWIKNW